MLRPKALHDDLAKVQAAGINTVVSLLEAQEAILLGLGAQADVCAALGMRFATHPIRDMSLPDIKSFSTFAAQIAADIHSGAHVAVHCRASIGRTGMLTCAVLGNLGYSADEAIAHVSAQRGASIPDTKAQAAFICEITSSFTAQDLAR